MFGVFMTSITASHILKYIEEQKSLECNKNESILSLLMEFCERNGIEEDEVGDIISRNDTLMGIVKNDCIKYKFMKQEVKLSEDW